jgi:hypothetical protein
MKTSENEYLGYIEEQLPNIFNLYKKFEDKKPVMLFDIQEQKIYAYPYNEFKSDLSKKSQTMLEPIFARFKPKPLSVKHHMFKSLFRVP